MKRLTGIALAFVLLSGFHLSAVGQHTPSQISNTKSTSYDGSDDYVTIGQPSNLEWDPNGKECTISLWAYFSSFTFQRIILGKAKMSSDNVSYVFGFLATNGSPYAIVGDGNNGSGTSSTGTWYNLTLTVRNVSGTYTFYLFKNGTQIGTGNAGSDQNTDMDWLIGGARWDTNSSLGYPYVGYIDEVTFWDSAFTDTDVTALYNGGRANNPTRHGKANYLLHWYRMGDSDTYPTITDRVGSANGTMTNMTSGAVNFVGFAP